MGDGGTQTKEKTRKLEEEDTFCCAGRRKGTMKQN
jgi:hypothetical protein